MVIMDYIFHKIYCLKCINCFILRFFVWFPYLHFFVVFCFYFSLQNSNESGYDISALKKLFFLFLSFFVCTEYNEYNHELIESTLYTLYCN